MHTHRRSQRHPRRTAAKGSSNTQFTAHTAPTSSAENTTASTGGTAIGSATKAPITRPTASANRSNRRIPHPVQNPHPVKPMPTHTLTRKRPIRRDIRLKPSALLEDAALLEDLKAAAHLQRRRPAELVADIVANTLGPRFAKQIAA